VIYQVVRHVQMFMVTTMAYLRTEARVITRNVRPIEVTENVQFSNRG